MCGIAGYKINKTINGSIIKTMVKALIHRGPDSEGYYSSESYSAGMRRLKINDIHTGDQPLMNEDKTVVLFYNGEIYNSPQLRQELESRGHRFRTHSDGEVICHLYEECGAELFKKLDGMFAAALWIEKEKKLILARDIPGEKPLYFSRLSKTDIVFASEIKSIKLFPGLDLTLDRQSIWDFPTFLWIPEPQTIYKNVQALMPGHMLIADDHGIKMVSYGNQFNTHQLGRSIDEIVDETREVVQEAVKSRLLSDVPIGCFLSSGLDSSIVTTIAAQAQANISTFTVGFEDVADPYHGTADESSYAEEYARQLGTKHRTIRVTADDFLNSLDKFCEYGDQPFAVSSGLGLLSVAKAAQEAGIKVLLSGDGADEIFGGYSWYSYFSSVGSNEKAGKLVDDISYQNFGMDIKERLKVMSGYTSQQKAWAWHYYASENEKTHLFSRDFVEGVDSSLRFFNQFKEGGSWAPEDYIKQDRQFYLPNEMLKKVDRMTMAYSIEGRAPFVAPSVLAHADKLRYEDCVKGKELKWVLRRAFENDLPSEIVHRPKHGFNIPIDHWLKKDWAFLMQETFCETSALSKMGIINKTSAQVATKMLNDKNRLNGHTIFTYIMLNRWLERYN